MKLSLWMIYDYLKKYQPAAYITDGRQELRMVRILSGQLQPGCSTLYLARAGEYFNTLSNKIICVHNHDFLLLESEDMDDILNQVLNCFELYNSWADSVTEMIERGCTVEEIFNAGSNLFHESLTFADASFIILSTWQPPLPSVLTKKQKQNVLFFRKLMEQSTMPMKDVLHARKVRQMYSSSFEPYTVKHLESGRPVLLRNLRHNGTIWGYLTEACFFTEPTTGSIQLLSELGNFLELWIQKNSVENKRADDFSALFQKAFDGCDFDSARHLEYHLSNFGWLPDCRKQLYEVSSLTYGEDILPTLGYRMNRFEGCVSNMVDNRLILLINLDLFSCRSDSAFYYLLQESGCFAIRSMTFTRITSLWQQKQPARVALRYCGREAGKIYDSFSYLSEYFMDIVHENSNVPFYHPAVTALLDYDQKNGTQMAETLFHFLLHERRYDQATKALFVHRNTIQYRIEKIVELTNVDLDDIRQRTYLLFVLYFHFNNRTDHV